MRKNLFIFGLLAGVLSLSASWAMACSCGKKGGNANQTSSCSAQCADSCGGPSGCSEGSFQLAQGTGQPEMKPEEAQATEVGNKICPVSQEKVGEMGDIVKYEYNGKIYNLCCKMCARDFKKDPEKYSQIAEEEVKAAHAQDESPTR